MPRRPHQFRQAFTLIEVGIATPEGVFVPDLAWASVQFASQHAGEIVLTQAPELCIEVLSPSNSAKVPMGVSSTTQ